MYRNVILLSFFLLLLATGGCRQRRDYVRIEGFAQGSTYHVICSPSSRADAKKIRDIVDGRLFEIDNTLSGYNKGSLLSRINAGEDPCLNSLFVECFERSKEIWEESEGLFDPSAAPLFDLWGFGFSGRGSTDDGAIDSVLEFVGMNLVSVEHREDGAHLARSDPRIRLNFNAIAQGYSCDVIARLLDSLGCGNYLVDIGREIICKGVNASGKPWKIGLDKPFDGNMEEGRELQAVIEVSDCGIVTSGNYRKFYVEDGQKFAHTINPVTGRPVTHSLLSATVVAKDATTADAYATWLMVAGPGKAREIVAAHDGIEALLVYDDNGEMKVFQAGDKILKTVLK